MDCRYDYKNTPELKDLIGKTATQVTGEAGGYEMLFTFEDGTKYVFHHHQDCCEGVDIHDIEGDLQDLIGAPLTMAEEVESGPVPEGHEPDKYGSETWTFYKFATVKGYVNVRWLGSSNGYYSESVDFCRVDG